MFSPAVYTVLSVWIYTFSQAEPDFSAARQLLPAGKSIINRQRIEYRLNLERGLTGIYMIFIKRKSKN
jgi:hypothetical protein